MPPSLPDARAGERGGRTRLEHADPDRAAWLARHVLPHESSLRAWLRHRRHLRLDPDDLIQESYAILAALHSVEHIAYPKAYMLQTIKSLILRDLRRAKIVSIQAVDDLDALGALADEPSPERQVSDRQELQRLLDAVEALPRQCRRVFKLRKFEGASQREIAVRLGLSEKTVEKHMARAVHRLVAELGRGGKPSLRSSIESKRPPQDDARKTREQS